jgi:hypothetical protein
MAEALSVDTRRYQRKRLSIGQTDFALKSIKEENNSTIPDLSVLSPAPTSRVLFHILMLAP